MIWPETKILELIKAGATSIPNMFTVLLTMKSPDDLNKQKILELARKKGFIDYPMVMKELRIDSGTAIKLLKNMVETGQLVKED